MSLKSVKNMILQFITAGFFLFLWFAQGDSRLVLFYRTYSFIVFFTMMTLKTSIFYWRCLVIFLMLWIFKNIFNFINHVFSFFEEIFPNQLLALVFKPLNAVIGCHLWINLEVVRPNLSIKSITQITSIIV